MNPATKDELAEAAKIKLVRYYESQTNCDRIAAALDALNAMQKMADYETSMKFESFKP